MSSRITVYTSTRILSEMVAAIERCSHTTHDWTSATLSLSVCFCLCLCENGSYLRTVFVTYTFHSLFITSCSTFRLIKAFIKKVFFFQCHIAFTLLMPTILNVFAMNNVVGFHQCGFHDVELFGCLEYSGGRKPVL